MSTTTSDLATSLRAQLKLQPEDRLYGVADAAQDTDFVFQAQEKYGQRIRSLFTGPLADSMREVAPYLVPIDPDTNYLDDWMARLEMNIGILFTTEVNVTVLWRHLREIFVAQDENGQEFFFRFYDQRVLRPYLKSCRNEQLREFMGPIHCIWDRTTNGKSMATILDHKQITE